MTDSLIKKFKLPSRLALLKEFLSKTLPLPSDFKLFFKFYGRNREDQGSLHQSIITQMPWDLDHAYRVRALLNVLKPKHIYGVRVLYATHWAETPLKRAFQKLMASSAFNYKWYLIYRAFGVKCHLNYWHSIKNQNDPRFQRIKSNAANFCTSKSSFMQMKFEEIIVGDLIYDTYIRIRPAPTLDLNDPYLDYLIDVGIGIYLDCITLLEEHPSADALITTYTAYIQHGILTRLALARGITVYAIASGNQLIAHPTLDFPIHKRNFHHYKKWADLYSNQDEMLSLGSEVMNNRFSGNIDAATSYMKESAYKKTSGSLTLNPQKKSAVIMAHDFYDSPHGWGKMLNEDLYEWLDFVLASASETDHDFYLKPHPNAVAESKPIYEAFLKKYPKIKKLDASTSNLTIARAGFTCAFTLYGTIAHEFCYLGLPTFSAGENPHSSFGFTPMAQSKEQLKSWIRELSPDKPDKNEVLKFVFMHNYCFIKDNIPILESITSSREFVRKIESIYPGLEKKMLFELEAHRAENMPY